MTLLTPLETAQLYWQCLETQRNFGLPWDVFKRVPPELQMISPLMRRITWRSPEPGVRLMCTMRVYCPDMAAHLLHCIGFDLLGNLQQHGYEQTNKLFNMAVLSWYENIKSLQHYGV